MKLFVFISHSNVISHVDSVVSNPILLDNQPKIFRVFAFHSTCKLHDADEKSSIRRSLSDSIA